MILIWNFEINLIASYDVRSVNGVSLKLFDNFFILKISLKSKIFFVSILPTYKSLSWRASKQKAICNTRPICPLGSSSNMQIQNAQFLAPAKRSNRPHKATAWIQFPKCRHVWSPFCSPLDKSEHFRWFQLTKWSQWQFVRFLIIQGGCSDHDRHPSSQ